MEFVKLTNICKPKQWKTLSAKEFIDDGKFIVYGANGPIGRYNEYNHSEETLVIGCRGSCGKETVKIIPPYSYINSNAMCFDNLDDCVNIKYLYYYLKHVNYDKIITGVAQPQITAKSLSLIMVPLRSANQQNDIIKLLSSIETEIVDLQKCLELLDELVKSRFVEMFGDVEKEPIFKTVKMGSVCNIGSSHRVFTSEFVNKGIPFYRGTEIGELANGKIPSDPYFISIEHYNRITCNDTKPQIGDILIPSICNKGQVWMVNTNDPFYYKDGRVLSISPNRKLINSKYFETYFKYKSLYEYRRLGDGATFAEFKIFILKEIDIILPPIELQNEFAAFVEQIDKSKFVILNIFCEIT